MSEDLSHCIKKAEEEASDKSPSSFDTLEDFLDYAHALKIKGETTTWYSLDDIKREFGL